MVLLPGKQGLSFFSFKDAFYSCFNTTSMYTHKLKLQL